MKVLTLPILTLPMVLWASSTSAFFDTYERKMNSHEEGTWNWVQEYAKPIDKSAQALISAINVTLHHRRQGQNHDHSEIIPTRYCALYQTLRQFAARRQKTHPKVIFPNSMQSYRNAMKHIVDLAGNTSHYTHCNQLTHQDKKALLQAALNLQRTEKDIIAQVRSRSTNYRRSSWSSNLTVEMHPLPFRVDVTNGEFRIKLTRTVGGMTFDGSSGVTERTGLKTLVILSGGYARIYAVGSRKMEFDIPRSNIKINGNTMVITYYGENDSQLSGNQ